MIRAENLSGDTHYWLGRLAAAVHVSPVYPKESRKVLEEFLRSPACAMDEALKAQLKGTPK